MRPLLLVVATLALGLSACDRPSEALCRKAVTNLQRLSDPNQTGIGPDPDKFVRKCTATGRKATTECLARAQSVDEVQACAKQ